MKKAIKTLSLGVCAMALFGCSASVQPVEALEEPITMSHVLRLDDQEEKPCFVTIDMPKHGSIETDIKDGEVGDVVTVTVKHDLLYKINKVTVNDTTLIESEETRGLFSFALKEGENKIAADITVDEELCGSLATIIQQATNKDWTNLFSVENVITIVKWVLDGGILIAIIRYYVKDKRLATKLEKAVKETTERIVPEVTKQSVLENTKALIEPMFNQAVQDGAAARQLMSIMVKCMVLMQQNTPEAKIAILDEFDKLKGIADPDAIANVKKYIEDAVASHAKAYEETLAKIEEISEKHKTDEEPREKEPKEEKSEYDGTQI